jgi:hypothetical protein
MKDWLLSIVWYGSVLSGLLGCLAIVRPLPRLGLATRAHGGVLLAIAALLLAMNAFIVPVTSRSAATASSAIDRVMPVYQFREFHERSVRAPLAEVWSAINDVTADEISLFQTFTAIRRFGRSGRDSILNAPADEPILAVATRTGFQLLARTDDEVVVGTFVAGVPGSVPRSALADPASFARVSAPGLVKATLNFRVEPARASETRLTTETRVFAVDARGLRQFTPYWRTIFPGSWMLRVTWLNAIARRAER